MRKAGAILSDVLKDHTLARLEYVTRLRSEWDGLVGGMVALHAIPVDLRDGVLFVDVDTSVWIQQLGFLKPRMISVLQAYGVKDIHFRLARAERRAPPVASRDAEATSLQEADRLLLKTCEDALPDPTLKEHVSRLLRSALGRMRRR